MSRKKELGKAKEKADKETSQENLTLFVVILVGADGLRSESFIIFFLVLNVN